MLRSLLFTALLGSGLLSGAAATAGTPPAKTLEFIENRGQWATAARYAAPVPGGRLFVEPDGLTYALMEPIDHHAKERPTAADKLRGHAVQVRFVAARAQAPQPSLPTGEVRNYFCGNEPARWASQVASYRQLRYQQLWPGIDARLYENAQQHLEYDFELAPNADPAAIRLHYNGADGLSVDAAGALQVAADVGSFTELPPQAWQLDATGQRQRVTCRYVLNGHDVSFQLGPYDHKRPLTIDPTVVFSTYTGSTAENWGFTATYDQQGNMYSGGIAFNLGYPASPGAFSTSFAGVTDMAIIKYNTATTGRAARLWATYLGGNSGDYPESMVVNNQGELLILGATGSSNYPTTAGAYDRSFNGGVSVDPYLDGPPYDLPPGSDLVVSRLNATGSALLGSTYLGGSNNDGLLNPSNLFVGPLVHNYGDPFRGDIIVDANDNVYLASNTASSNFPAVGGFRTTFGTGGSDAVVCKLNAGLTSLLWSTYLGGSGADAAYSLRLDATNNLYVCGGTTSPNFPTTPGALISTLRGDVDGFVVRLNNTGSALLGSTYIGTSSYDQAYFVQLDNGGNVYLLGQSLGNYPVTAGRYANAGSHQFIHCLNPDLTASSFSTVFGSGRTSIDISPTAFLVDQCDRIYASGWGGQFNSSYAPNGNTAGMPVSANAVQRTTDANDFYLIALSPNAQALEYATYYGANDASVGDHVDGGTSRFDPRGVVYQAVCACSSAPFPIPPGAGTYSTSNQGSYCNNAAFKFQFEISVASAGPAQTICANAAPLRLGGTPFGGTWSGPGVSGSVANGFFFTPSTALIGMQTLTYAYTGGGTCSSQASLQVTVTTPPAAVFAPLSQSQFCQSSGTLPPVTLVAQPAGGTFSGRGVVGNLFYPSVAGAGVHPITYSFSQNGCTSQATQTATVIRPPTIGMRPDTVICAGSTQAVQLRASPAGGTWSGPNVSASGLFTPPTGFIGPVTLTYTATVSGCTASATRRIGVVNAPALAPSWSAIVCTQDKQAPLRVRFSGVDAVPGTRWDFGDGTPEVAGTTVEHVYTQAGTFTPRVTVPYNGGLCQQLIQLRPVEVVAAEPLPNVITPNGDNLNDRFMVGYGCPPQLQVFSRWGNKVYEAAAYQNNWNGDGLPAGIYYYLVRFPDGNATKGWVEIVR
ncbi:gliding motility-associated C-terminal domain-containing protein [Hymenobacter sp. CRA2]|uniref:DUF7948 domain-containing protein n=1 Tax=Hymenobacter sp. CRA2 TaxID=1955620 RepID=UPI00098FC29C|nr:gliding motility-associated C-terminal domain-containing protein [Hymenobacter sp. CRA2]OON66722.1 hypothetical protein B0919_21295 [Hymenobacter sp. CRA2]